MSKDVNPESILLDVVSPMSIYGEPSLDGVTLYIDTVQVTMIEVFLKPGQARELGNWLLKVADEVGD